MLAVCSFWCACTISEKIRPPSERRVVDVDKWPLAAIKSRLKEGHGRADDCSLVPLAQRKSVLMAGTCTQSVPWATRRPHVLLAPLHPSVPPSSAFVAQLHLTTGYVQIPHECWQASILFS